MKENEQKVALVTGGSRGIGRAISLRLSQLGMAVVINYARDNQSAEELVFEITAKGGQAKAARADVSKIEKISEIFDSVISQFGRLDVLINNAGIATYKKMRSFRGRIRSYI